MEKPTLPKGTRDFGPAIMAKRQFIFDTIRNVYKKFGFMPLETPTMENLSVLTGKYGEEGDQLLFRILDSGDFLKDFKEEIEKYLKSLFSLVKQKSGQTIRPIDALEEIIKTAAQEITYRNDKLKSSFCHAVDSSSKSLAKNFGTLLNGNPNSAEALINSFDTQNLLIAELQKDFIAEKGLRYDLTVPFARYVVMNRHEIALPFKRYQIQPVWRADRPQKGRYREFYQCDADVVGTYSLVCEVEIILMIREAFDQLGIKDYTIKINHRDALAGIAELLNAKGKETELYTAIDKLDKIGEKGVRDELKAKGFEDASLNDLFNFLSIAGNNYQKLDFLSGIFKKSTTGPKGEQDLRDILGLLASYGTDDNHVQVDTSLARGLSYYTGTIFEVKINNVAIGSVSGGGRYDNLTQAFGSKEPLPGIGISFGVDRIYDAMEELELFPKDTQVSSTVLVCHFNDETMRYGLGVLSALRQAGIASEIYPEEAKLKKQLDYANKKLVPYAIVIGTDEIKSGQLACKNMTTGVQEQLSVEQIIQKLTVKK